jgi:hypothetical protein
MPRLTRRCVWDRCRQVCRHWAAVGAAPELWRRLCADDWLATKTLSDDHTWLDMYIVLNAIWGRYRACFVPVVRAWRTIAAAHHTRCPWVETLNGAVHGRASRAQRTDAVCRRGSHRGCDGSSNR